MSRRCAVLVYSTQGEAHEVSDEQLEQCIDRIARRVGALNDQQRSRVVHVKHATFDVYIGRAMPGYKASPFANPFKLRSESERRAVVRAYARWLIQQQAVMQRVQELAGKRVGCWCRKPGHDVLCHGLVLIALAEA
jgi:hypothetical protein